MDTPIIPPLGKTEAGATYPAGTFSVTAAERVPRDSSPWSRPLQNHGQTAVRVRAVVDFGQGRVQDSDSRSALASFKSAVANPSVNHS